MCFYFILDDKNTARVKENSFSIVEYHVNWVKTFKGKNNNSIGNQMLQIYWMHSSIIHSVCPAFSCAVAIEFASGQQCILWLPWSMVNNKHWSGVSTNRFFYRFQSTFFYHSLYSMNASIYAICPNEKRVLFNIFFICVSKCTPEPLNEEKSHLPAQQQCNLLQNHFTIWLSEANVKRSWKNTYFYSCLYGATFCSFDWNQNGNKVKRNFFYDSLPLRPNSDRVIFQLKIIFSLCSLFVVGIQSDLIIKSNIPIDVRITPLKFKKIHIFPTFFSIFCSQLIIIQIFCAHSKR